MRRLSATIGILASVGLLGPIGGCGDPRSAVPTAPSAPGAAGIEITGPATVAPGQAAQFGAVVRLADGTVKASSPGTLLVWSSSNSSVLAVTPAGVATGVRTGDAYLTVRIGTFSSGRQATREVVVVPEGTYRMVGTVTDAESLDFPVAGARVDVTPGSLSTTTDFDGKYRLYGVPASAVVEVTRSGYAPVTQGLQLSAHVTQNFQMTLTGPRLDISGPYTLVIDATNSCGGSNPLSPDLRRRVYDAVVTQNGTLVSVVLTEPRFKAYNARRGNEFHGRVDSTSVAFLLEPYLTYYYYYYGVLAYPDVAEILANGTYLIPQGSLVATWSAASLAGQMNGTVENYDSRFPDSRSVLLGYCIAPSMTFTLTPR